MRKLKINVSVGSFKINLEGASEDVMLQFNDIKTNGLGKMFNEVLPFVTRVQVEGVPPSETKLVQEGIPADPPVDKSPSLKNILLRQLPASEAEWILIYGSYATVTDEDSFTREDLVEKYKESGRNSDSNISNLYNSIKSAVLKTWINPINNEDFMVTTAGKGKLKEILDRTTPFVRPTRKVSKVKAKQGAEQS